MKKVLLAINNQPAENKLSKLIKQADPDNYQIVGTLVSNESISDYLKSKTADILVYIEGLNGKDDGFDYILRLHRNYPHIRIVFIAGQRSVGDKKLATLVAYHIYDIIAGRKILMSDVADRIINPAKFEDVIIYLPDGADIFKDSDFGSRGNTIQSAQNDSDRIAEKAELLKQIGDLESQNKTHVINLTARDARIKELEAERANWQAELSKERMAMDKKHEADLKVLNEAVLAGNSKNDELSKKLSDQEKKNSDLLNENQTLISKLTQQQLQSSEELKKAQSETRSALNKLEDLNHNYNSIKKEYDDYKKSSDAKRDAEIKSIKSDYDKKLNQANDKITRLGTHNSELQAKIKAFGDLSIEEYTRKETERIEKEKAKAENQIAKRKKEADAEIEHNKKQAQKHIDELINATKLDLANKQIAFDKEIEESRKKVDDEIKIKREQGILTLTKEYDAAMQARITEIEDLDKQIDFKRHRIDELQLELSRIPEEITAAKADAIKEVDNQLLTKQQEIANLDAEIKKRHGQQYNALSELNDKIADKQKNIDEMDKMISDKQNEIKSFDSDIAKLRERKAEELAELEKEYAQKSETAIQLLLEENETQIANEKKKLDQELKKINKAFNSEKKRLDKELDAYKKEIEEEKNASDQESAHQFVYNEADFVIGQDVSQKFVPVMFHSPIPGSGNSTLAINVATLLAKSKKKTIYVELNTQNPTLKENINVTALNDNIDSCIDGLINNNFDEIKANIITKQKMTNLKTDDAEIFAKFPDMISFLSYNAGVQPKHKLTIDLIKGLIAYLRYSLHYEYVILDVPSHMDKSIVYELYSYCRKNITSINQDFISINNLMHLRADLKKGTPNYYVVNKYMEGTALGNQKIAECCGLRKITPIPLMVNDVILATYKAIPAVLISRSKELVSAYMMISEYVSQ